MSNKQITIEGTLYWAKLTVEDEWKPGKHSFEVGQLSDETIAAIEDLGTKAIQDPRRKNLDKLKKKVRQAESDEAREKAEFYLQQAEEIGYFISLKQNIKTKAGKDWPIAAKNPAGEDYSLEDLARLSNGCKIKCDIKTFTTQSGDTFYSYVPYSLKVTEEVLYEAPTEEEPTTAPAEESAPFSDPLDGEVAI